MSTNTVISNQDERKLPLENTNKQTYIHDIHLMNSHQETHIHIDTTHTSVYYLAIITHTYTHKNCAKYSPKYRLDQLCIRRLFDKKEYYYDYCYILLSTTPFPTKIHKKLLS